MARFRICSKARSRRRSCLWAARSASSNPEIFVPWPPPAPRRSPFVPAVPTVREAGYPALEDLTWYGFFLPAKTPANVVEKLNTVIQETLRTDEVKSGMGKLAVEPDAIAMGDFARLIASESDRWKAIVQATGFAPTD
ncbi:tripartite tricarboxylate transporter substrate-binding protein [Bradyrhizobium sp. 153]|uniref:Bug family tripartite tricarboxylate transporter substrate binding protein n=1 Tax=Bradyrhizobium sp. 153 TaxID=2782627 RepID=UPI002096D1FB|nr:tripartite tricarboxylate transporter substrate-binding protein [Bradyrhizobium sp. 153]